MTAFSSHTPVVQYAERLTLFGPLKVFLDNLEQLDLNT